MAFGAKLASAVARLHHPELDFVGAGCHEVEELRDAVHIVFGVAVPQEVVLFLGEVVDGAIDREVELGGVADEVALPLAHDLAVPAGHRVLGHRQRTVGEDQVGVHAFDHAGARAGLACAVRVVEAEHIDRRFLEGHAIGLEEVAECLEVDGIAFTLYGTDALAFVEGHVHGIGDACLLHFEIVGLETVHQDEEAFRVGEFLRRYDFVNFHQFVVAHHAVETLLPQNLELFGKAAALGNHHRSQHIDALSGGGGHDVAQHVAHVLSLHLAAAHGRAGVSDAGEKQLEVLVNLRHRAHRGTRVVRHHVLLDGNGRRDARHGLHVGFAHPPHELAGVGAQALHIAPLPFSIKRVEGQRRLARA